MIILKSLSVIKLFKFVKAGLSANNLFTILNYVPLCINYLLFATYANTDEIPERYRSDIYEHDLFEQPELMFEIS